MDKRIVARLVAFGLILVPVLALGQAGRGRGHLFGVVQDDRGLTLHSAKVSIRFLEKAQSRLAKNETGGLRYESAADEDGRWRFLGLGTGWWRVEVTAEGFEPARIDHFVMQLYDSKPLTVKLNRPAVLKNTIDMGLGGQNTGEMFNLRGPDAAVYERVLVQDKDPDAALLAVASVHLENGDFAQAAKDFGQVCEHTQTDPLRKALNAAALAGRGESLFRQGDWDGALRDLASSFELRPNSEITAFDLAEIHFAQKRAADAILFYREAIRISPDWSDPFEKLGNALLHQGALADASDAFRRFLVLEPNGARAIRVTEALKEIEKIRK
jgi:tetratricopeptide (TPR) repeat protein